MHAAHLLPKRGMELRWCSMAHPHPCWMRLLFTVILKRLTKPAGDVAGAVIGREKGRVWAGQGVARPLDKHSS